MTTVLADEPFTRLDDAIERLDDAVSPLVGIVTHTVSTTHTPDEASLPELRRRARMRTTHGRRRDRPVRERCTPASRPCPGGRARRGARALLGALRPARAAAALHGPRARRGRRPPVSLRALPSDAARGPDVPVRGLHRGHVHDLRRGRVPRGRATRIPSGGARLPRPARDDRPPDRVLDVERARVRPDIHRGRPCGAPRAGRARRGDARVEGRALASAPRLVRRPRARRPRPPVLRSDRRPVPASSTGAASSASQSRSRSCTGTRARGRPWRSEPELRARSGRRGSRRSWRASASTAGCASRRSRVPTPRLPSSDAIETFDDHMLFYAEPEQRRASVVSRRLRRRATDGSGRSSRRLDAVGADPVRPLTPAAPWALRLRGRRHLPRRALARTERCARGGARAVRARRLPSGALPRRLAPAAPQPSRPASSPAPLRAGRPEPAPAPLPVRGAADTSPWRSLRPGLRRSGRCDRQGDEHHGRRPPRRGATRPRTTTRRPGSTRA